MLKFKKDFKGEIVSCAENWNDGISVRDLERVANQHDFTWTDEELADMIRCFDSDGDGKVNDFFLLFLFSSTKALDLFFMAF